jgi:penicillin-binding protein 1A
MGLDKPQKIKGNAQGGQLAAPAWTAFMKEVYRRKPAPPDWPKPDGIVARQIDPTTGLLWAPGCPQATEYFIAGTDPVQTCAPPVNPYAVPGATVDTSFGFPPVGSPPPRQPPPVATPYPDTTRRPFDTLGARPPTGSPGSVVIPGAAPIPRATRPIRSPRDTMRPTPFDSLRIPRDTTRPARDTARVRRDTTNPFKIPPV